MKNKFIYTLACTVALSITSCSKDFLEIVPYDTPTVDGFYNSRDEIRSVTATLYGRPWFEYNDKFSWAAGDGMAGDLFNDYQHEGQLFFFQYSDNNDIISQGWRSLYNIVAYSNAIINDMPRVAGGNNVAQEDIDAALGEARFTRAYAYYLLAEYWDEVPIIENAAGLIAADNIQVEKNTTSSVYEFIIRDLEFAAENLPASDVEGRVTQWAAKGLLAKVHLTRAHRLGMQGDFGTASAYAQDVIQNSGHSLMSNYADLFKIENNNNSETLYALQWIGGTWGLGNSRQAVFARNARITNNSEAWGGFKSATFSFMENLQQNAEGRTDLRRPAIYMTLGDHYPEIMRSEGGYTYNLVTPDPEGDGNLDDPNFLLNNIKKYVVGSMDDVGRAVNNQGVPLNQYMLRLADVYLIHTEAAIGAGNETADGAAMNSYNAVRARAGLAPRASVTYRQLFNERRVEFGMEGINWLDVKRFFYKEPGTAIDYLNNQDRAAGYERRVDAAGEPIGDANSFEGYVRIEPETPVNVSPNNMRFPVPNAEVSYNPNLGPSAQAVDYVFE